MRANNRLLSILLALGAEGDPATLTRLADAVGLPKSTTLRFLRSLEPDGWVVRNAGGSYVLGPAVIALASQYLSSDPVLVAAPPLMRELRDALGETISLSRVMGLERTCIHEFPSVEPLRLVLGVGSPGPLHAGASGLLLLAHLPEDHRQRVYEAGLAQYTRITLTDAGALEEECARIRARGWAVTYGQKTAGGVAIAVAVRDPNAPGTVSALGAFGPQARFDEAVDEERWRDMLQTCATAIERSASLHLPSGPGTS